MTESAEELRMHLSQAYTRAVHPDAIQHLHEALRLVDPDVPPGFVTCDDCGQYGHPDGAAACDC